MFLLDIAGTDRAPKGIRRTFTEDNDWAVLSEVSASEGLLTRKITTFRRTGELYRRSFETHQQQLISPHSLETQLESSGFHVERLSQYDTVPLLPGVYGFKATKTS